MFEEITLPANLPPTDYYHVNDLLRPEERTLRDRVRQWVDREVIPIVEHYWDRAEFPFEIIPKMRELGIVGGPIRGYGSPGFSLVAAGLVAQELARGDSSVATFYGVHSGLAMGSIAILGSKEQRERWLPPMARLEKIGAFALTEPTHGSDSIALETSARRDGSSWVLRGAKKWIGNASFADIVVVWARDEAGDVGGVRRRKGHAELSRERHRGQDLQAGRVAGADRARRRADPAREPARAGAHVQGHGKGSNGDALRRRVGGDRPGDGRVRVRPGILSAAQAVRTAARVVPARAGQAGPDACGDHGDAIALSAPEPTVGRAASDASDGVARENEQLPEGAQDHCGRARSARWERHSARVSRCRHFADIEGVYTYEGTDHMQMLVVGKEICGVSAFK
jgi:glutaryl-CoA dehydrogenase